MSVKAYIYCAKNGWVKPGSSVSIDIDRNMISCSAVFDNFSSYPGGKMITTISTGNYGSYQTTLSNDEPEGSDIQQQNGVTITDFDQMSVGSSKTVAISFDAYMTDSAGNIVERDAFTTTATLTRVQESSSGGGTTTGDLSCNMTMFKASSAQMVTCHKTSSMLYEEAGTIQGAVVAYNHNDVRYNNVIFTQDISSVSTSLFPFIKTTYNGMTCYISAYLTIGFITYRQALREQKICKIGEKLYRMALMPLSFWNSLSEDILKQLPAFSTWTWIENSFSNYVPCVTHGSGHYYINVDNGKNPAYNSRQEQFLPVLVEIAAFNTGDILSVGNWVASDNYGNYSRYSAPVDTSNALNYVNYLDVSFDNTLLDNPLHWICYKDTSGRTYFICDRFAFSDISYSSAQQLCASFSPMTLYNRKFKLDILSLNEYNSISSMLCPDYGGYHFYNGSTNHIMTSTIEGSDVITSSTISYTVNEMANEVDTIISISNTTAYSQTLTAPNLYFVPALREIELPTINVGNADLGTITAWTNIIYSIDSTTNVTVTEYLNGEIINPVVIDFDPSVNNILTYRLDSTEFSNLPIGQVNTIRITAENLDGMAEATITFTKSDGKIKLGYWDAISATDKTTNFYPTGEIQSIVGSAYSEIVLNTSGTSENLYTWIPFTANDKQFYICDQFGINHISYHEVFNKIININTDVVIDGYNYRLTLLKLEDLAYVKDINYNFYPAASIINNTIDGSYCCLVSMVQGIYGITIDTDNIVFNAHNTDDRHSNLYYIPILVKTEASVVRILYSGNNNLGVISQPPSIIYSTKGATGNVQIEESVGGKVINNRVSSVGATNTFTISESTWKTLEADKQLYITIKVTDVNNNTDSLVIAFTKLHICNRINFHIGPLTTPKRCDYILAAANTDATDVGIIAVKFYACNNVYDDIPTWIEGVKDDSTSDPLVGFDFSTCTSKTSSQWGVAIKIVVESQDKMDNLIICGMNGVAIRLEDGSYF